MYRNKWDTDVLPINKIFSYVRMLVPRVYFNAPRVTVTATHPDFVVHARVVEAIDNMLLTLNSFGTQSGTCVILGNEAPSEIGLSAINDLLNRDWTILA
jgi:hypothetical protein